MSSALCTLPYHGRVLFLGHIAATLLIADASDSDRAAAVAGNLLPDVVDKSGGWLLRVMPSSRWLAHGLPCFFTLALFMRLPLDERRWRGFVLGYAGHLLCDLWAGGRVPWWAPFGRPARGRRWRARGLQHFLYLLPELLALPLLRHLLQPRRLPLVPGSQRPVPVEPRARRP